MASEKCVSSTGKKSKWKKKHRDYFNIKEREQYYIVIFPSEIFPLYIHTNILCYNNQVEIHLCLDVSFVFSVPHIPKIIFDLLRMKRECLPGIEMNETEGQNWSVPNHGQMCKEEQVQVSPDSLFSVIVCDPETCSWDRVLLCVCDFCCYWGLNFGVEPGKRGCKYYILILEING